MVKNLNRIIPYLRPKFHINFSLPPKNERGETEGKMNIAKKVNELGLDAIHDTVHEMTKGKKNVQWLLSRHL